MKVVHISDTHNFNDQIKVPAGDVLIHSGDATISSTVAELKNFASWFSSLPHKVKIYTPGNHDYEMLNYKFEHFAKLFPKNIDLITVGGLTVQGVKIFCCAAPGGWGAIPSGVDILVTHYPPYAVLDEIPAHSKFNPSDHSEHAGSHELLSELARIRPRYHLFGHIHEDGGRRMVTEHTTYANSAMLDENYKLKNEAYVFEIEAKSDADSNVSP